jgi:type IV pilus biogenesis protein PilP
VVAKAEAPAQEVANSEVFTFRDIFVPLIKEPPTTTAGATTPTSTPDTVTPTTQNTLYLDGVVTQNGVLMAQLRYNGASYTLAAGGTIPGSPWQVLRVSSTSVTMLYGDIQVTLAVGEGVTK